ncbi:C4-dicarboxylate transporter/malic acid transport protein-like protein [Aulographum hederae CBS 113979]|uniref:C4-dicarboxylate transporter/malic acid transport protein-like protein n=1 Tax=Aulographum hederae CBS 113979 TaxID=1176131 RepID=A0A6G1GM46_9PEZI|nr:C4-dicarboxylate transporter/malic acid transport protein-like protein [Aulographum hederae CBS 113979]
MATSKEKNEDGDVENGSRASHDTVPYKERIRHFTWSWFATTMSTGAIPVLISNSPYTFRGLITIGKIFYILDIVLFLAYCAIMTTRFILRPRALTRSLHYPSEALFFGAFWVSIALILTSASLYGVPACGPWLIKALEIAFWVYVAAVLLVAIFQYHTLFVAEKLRVDSAMPAWILPIYPFLVLGPLAGTLANTQPTSAAIPILIGGVMFQGLGWIVSIFVYTIYIMRLMGSELPAPPTRPGMFISVGPAGYTATAFVQLGTQAQQHFPPGWLGVSTPAGDIVKVMGIMCGIFLWLLAFWFFSLSVVGVLEGVKRMKFTLNWAAFIFPNAGLCLAAIQIGNALDSTGIKAVATGMIILLVVVWIFVAVCLVLAVRKGSIMWPGMDEDAGMDA